MSVTVHDVRDGWASIEGWLGIYDPETSCICGDANDDGEVCSGDIVYLLNYLFGGASPPDPMETGDVNNDCVVDVGDITYLQNYFYYGGSPPVCGWICPPE